MNQDKTGGPAFPVNEMDQIGGHIRDQHMGLTLRDYFAARALSALLTVDGTQLASFAIRAEESYEIADAMLKVRKL